MIITLEEKEKAIDGRVLIPIDMVEFNGQDKNEA